MLKLKRISETPSETYGVLFLHNQPQCVTLELPYRDNHRMISSIPKGIYRIYKHNSPRHGKTLWIKNVKGRSEILIHAGNTTRDTRGCILLGEQFGFKQIINSKKALNELLSKLTYQTTLEII